MNDRANNWEEKDFWESVETQFEEKAPDFSKTLNIALSHINSQLPSRLIKISVSLPAKINISPVRSSRRTIFIGK